MSSALFVVAALVLSATTAAAQVNKKVELLAGGNTIAGPGGRTLEGGSTENVFRQTATTPMNLCATVANVGKAGTVVTIAVRDPGGTFNASAAEAGEGAGVCRNASNDVLVSCTPPGQRCQVLWRVDQPR